MFIKIVEGMVELFKFRLVKYNDVVIKVIFVIGDCNSVMRVV